jgi:hypothetical protein
MGRRARSLREAQLMAKTVMRKSVNCRIYVSRPPASCRGARRAWDYFTSNDDRDPVSMWRAFLDYWVWVMEWEDGEFEEIDALELRV